MSKSERHVKSMGELRRTADSINRLRYFLDGGVRVEGATIHRLNDEDRARAQKTLNELLALYFDQSRETCFLRGYL